MKKYANHIGWSDVHPFEIVREISDKTLEIRPMDATLDPNFTPKFDVGGFVGHCTNQHEQSYTYFSKPDAPTIKIRLHKNGWWKSSTGSKFELSDTPQKFYDYNF